MGGKGGGDGEEVDSPTDLGLSAVHVDRLLVTPPIPLATSNTAGNISRGACNHSATQRWGCSGSSRKNNRRTAVQQPRWTRLDGLCINKRVISAFSGPELT